MALEAAYGRPVDLAIDFNPVPLAVHESNHPRTKHVLADIRSLNPLDFAQPGEVEAIWASPPCVAFSSARGNRPIPPGVADLPWLAVHWLKALRPRFFFGENVERMELWGPVADGAFIPSLKGSEFKKWTAAISALGYELGMKVLKACDFGAPTSRERLFFVGKLDGRNPLFPEPTHGPGRLSPHPAFKDCMIPGLPGGDPASKTIGRTSMRKIRLGLRRYVNTGLRKPKEFGGLDAFIFSSMTHSSPRPILSPFPAITTRSGFYVIFFDSEGSFVSHRRVDPEEMKRAQGFPTHYDLSAASSAHKKQFCVGNSVSPPPAIHLIKAYIGD